MGAKGEGGGGMVGKIPPDGGKCACLIRLFASGIVCMSVRLTILVVTCA